MPWDVQLILHFEMSWRNSRDRCGLSWWRGPRLLREQGPAVGRPAVDTLKGSRHANMKELRFTASGGVWRVAFAFDRSRRAVLLAAGNKKGRMNVASIAICCAWRTDDSIHMGYRDSVRMRQ